MDIELFPNIRGACYKMDKITPNIPSRGRAKVIFIF